MLFSLIWNHHKCLSQLFLIHLNTYVMGLRSFEICNSFSAGTVLRRQNLTFEDVRFWRIKTSESDVYRRQILTYKDGPSPERVALYVPRLHNKPYDLYFPNIIYASESNYK